MLAVEPEGIRALLIEDDVADARLLGEELKSIRGATVELSHLETFSALLDVLSGARADVLLLDLSLPDVLGLEAVRCVRAVAPSIPIVVLTGNDDEASALAAVKEGAQ